MMKNGNIAGYSGTYLGGETECLHMRLWFIIHRFTFIILASTAIVFAKPEMASAAPASITFRYQHHLFTLLLKDLTDWRGSTEQWMVNGVVVQPPEALLTDGDEPPTAPAGMARAQSADWNRAAIARDLEKLVIKKLAREPGNVTIGRDAKGKVTFEGVGLPGRSIDLALLTDVTVEALERTIDDVIIPVTEVPPVITVTDPALSAAGIREVVTVGESEFTGSPNARRHNIAVGMKRFNGVVVPKGSIFSFVKELGPVNAAAGYWKELVIKGDRTEPDYGGGLCQVSSTAYRGVWEYGFPIIDRRNHSYTVRHYAPQGTDATVYPGSADIKFKNDSPGDLLIQTHIDGDLAYFIYYGTRDGRRSDVFGPFIWDKTGVPADRMEMTTDLAPGERKKLGERVPGMKAAWFRVSTDALGAKKVEPVYSHYQARPLFYLVGAAAAPDAPSVP